MKGGRTLVSECEVAANKAKRGGGVCVLDGKLVMTNRTLLTQNKATADDSDSAFLKEKGSASIHYVLDAPPGRYMSRTGRLTSDGLPWPELLGRAVQAFAPGAVSEDFPYACAAGAFGQAGAPEAEQSGPSCSGRCPAGKKCPGATVEPLPCDAGGYCAAGSAVAVPCPGGTYSSSTNLKAEDECISVGPGKWAPMGSARPVDCPASGFLCPGAADDDANDPPGSLPILIEVGAHRETKTETVVVAVEVPEVKLNVTLAADVEAVEAALEAYRRSFAERFNVPLAWIVPEVAGGSAVITFTIRRPADADAADDDVDLAAVAEQAQSLSTVELSEQLNVTVVAATPAELVTRVENVTRVVAVELEARCPKGHYCNAGSKFECPPNTYNDVVNATDLSFCKQCPPGTLSEALGLSSNAGCRPCPKGKWCSAGKEIPCSRGFYNDVEGGDSMAACKPCPLESSTDGEGSTSAADCMCNPTFYKGDETCLPCPLGAACSDPGTTLATLPLDAGAWRIDNASVDVRRCPDGHKPDETACVGTASSNATELGCRANHTGVYCRACIDDAAFFNPTTSACEPCAATSDDATGFATTVGVAGAVLVALLVGCFVALVRKKRPKRAGAEASLYNKKKRPEAAWKRWRVVVALRKCVTYLWGHRRPIQLSIKLLVSFFQIATKVPTVYLVRMPPPVQSVVKIFGLSSLDLDAFGLPWRCLGIGSFFNRLLALAVGPLVLLFTAFFFALALTLRARRRERRTGALTVTSAAAGGFGSSVVGATFVRALPALGLISFFAFPVVSSYAFRAFDCECFDNGESYLRVDYSLMCSTGCVMPSRPMLFETNATGAYTAEYWEVQYLARAAIGVYPVGVPLLYLILLLAARKALSNEEETRLSAALGFLHREYEPRYFWWEVLEILKKLMLVGFMAVVVPGSVYQLVIAMMISLALLLLTAVAAPYRSDVHDFLALGSSFCSS